MNKFIENMILFSNTKLGLNYNKMLEYCNMYSDDRRYKPSILACSNNSGIIKYKKIKYYYYQFSDRLELEIMER